MKHLRTLTATVLATLTLPVAAAASEACPDIAADAERLACYDRAAGRSVAPAALPVAAPAAAPEVPPTSAQAKGSQALSGWLAADTYVPSTFSERWQVDPGTKDGIFKIKPYQPVYLLPVSWRKNVNVSPCSPNPVNCATGAGATDLQTEAKFQISLKTKVLQDILGSPVDLWAAYTQQSFWQIYDADNSRPFRETNYQPEAWLTLPMKVGPEWLQWRMTNVGIVHQSNGQTDPLSRSWNRIYATFGLTSGNLSLFVKPWWRIRESAASDNNPDISDYAGRIELQAVYAYRAHVFSAKLQNNLRFGSSTPTRSSFQADWAFPLYGELHGYVQGFAGYADSLQNYNFRNAGIGLGVSLVEWR
jgi:phospholipase A1/A2